MTIRDRIVDFQRVRAGDILPHPLNWRKHDKRQREYVAVCLERLAGLGLSPRLEE